MKMTVSLALDVDLDAYARSYGLDRAEAEADARDYLRSFLRNAATDSLASIDAGARLVPLRVAGEVLGTIGPEYQPVPRSAGMPRFDDSLDRCPACGDVIDYCQGHGEIGDPAGRSILDAHDEGDHRNCDPRGCLDGDPVIAIERMRDADDDLFGYAS